MTSRERYLLGVIIILVGALLFSLNRPEEKEEQSPSLFIEENTESVRVAVHIGGAVRNPGLYYLDPSSRVADAIQSAGGPTADADLDAINLASRVTDGLKIVVPSRVNKENSMVAADSGQSSGTSESGGKININTASARELEELPGIGEVLAERIVSFRETNGPFKSIEEIKKVSGIGEKKFESIRDLIVVE
ncbi:MAG TPA: ComEA family DNA-binding protein [bacterium]|mgnify:CR=1 FL=1|nr:ComEA family DNA-binding protein [bacterium]